MKRKPTPGQMGLFDEQDNIPSLPPLLSGTITSSTIIDKIDVEKLSSKYMQKDSLVPRLTNKGDMWLLGKHKLYCENSAKLGNIDTLLNSEKVQLIHSDPPYNVKVQPQSKDEMKASSRKLEGDFISDTDFQTLLHYWFIGMARALEPGCAFYIWGGYSNITNYPGAIRVAGLYYSQAIIWVKGTSVFTRKDFMGQHEICFYGWKETVKGTGRHRFMGPNNITDVWSVANVPRKQMIHLTEKPVEIPARAISYSSKEGDKVLDLFGGSGSTLVAAEELNRQCFLMEIDPWYCDVIVDRCKKMGLEVRKA